MTEGLPEPIALRPDPRIRRQDRGRTLLGGSPFRLLRLTDAGAAVADDLLAGAPVGSDPVRRSLARRLLDTGLAHPVPPPTPGVSVTVVVPVRDRAPDVQALLDPLDGEAPVTVVDDGSRDHDALLRGVGERAEVVRHARSRGPGAARNTGWRRSDTDVVVFVDADVSLPRADWLAPLLAHFADPDVGAVAPRVRAKSTSSSVLDRYEAHRSPLDLGAEPARVHPRGRVAYVPTAALAVRRAVLEELDGFDETIRYGEDVDLVWRIVAAGHTVRYEPSVVVHHENRPTWAALCRQRMDYGSSAAVLDRRHPGQVPPVELNAWSLGAWALAVVGGRRSVAAGVATAGVSTAALVPKLRGRVEHPGVEALRLAGLGNLLAGRWLAVALVRAWLPPALLAALVSKRARRVLVAAVVVPNLLEWRERRPGLDPVRWIAARFVDDAATCAGLWAGCREEDSWRALRPRLTGVPGLTTPDTGT